MISFAQRNPCQRGLARLFDHRSDLADLAGEIFSSSPSD
jgi:hypothetical protein